MQTWFDEIKRRTLQDIGLMARTDPPSTVIESAAADHLMLHIDKRSDLPLSQSSV